MMETFATAKENKGGEAGRDVLVNLTYQESSLLMAYRRRLAAGSTDTDEDPTIWVELAERHEHARPR